MGNEYLIQQAVESASYDMYSRVQPAVDAITAAINKVRPLLDHGTWSGPAAQDWISQWISQHNRVLNLLAEMPGAELKVISDTRAQMAALALRMNRS